jgi:hypothetical protein
MKSLFVCSRHKDEKETTTKPSSEIYDDKGNAIEKEASPEPPFSESLADSRTVYVEYHHYWNLHNDIRVMDSDKSTDLYTIAARYRKPQMTVHSARTNSDIATVVFHNLKTRIEMTYHGQEMVLNSGGFLGVKYSYDSPTLNGEKMMWQPRKKLDDLNMVLLNGQGIAIARYKPNYKSCKRGGALEMLAECVKNEQLMEEVIVMAMAVIHYKETQRIMASGTTVIA